MAPGVLAGLLTLLGAMFSAAGYPAAAAFVSDPDTAQAITYLMVGVGALISGMLQGEKDHQS